MSVSKCLFFVLMCCCCLIVSVDNLHFNFQSSPSSPLYDSPCPDIFEYASDGNGELHGKILVRNPSADVITLNVELSVGNSVQGYNGNVQLGYSRAKVINDIVNGRPLLYKVSFPVWRRIPPRITKITLNGRLICSGPPLNIKTVPVLTTINLQHTLKINVPPGLAPASPEYPFEETSFSSRPGQPISDNTFPAQPAADDFNENNGNNDPATFEYPTNPFFSRPTTRRPQFDPNQIITFVAPSTTRATTERQPALEPTPEIDVRNSDLEEVCGKSLATNYLISYGNPVTRGHHPWLAALYSIQNLGLVFICGGNLVSTKHVLTAAHCLRRNGRKINTDDLLVILGKHNIQQWVDNESQMLYAKDITLHPDYKELTADADIAMITLTKEVQFKKFIRPICLWSERTELELVVGELGIVAGWGKDENGVQTSAEAKQVVLPIVSQEICINSQETFAELVSSRTFCAGYRNGSGPCNGDSGGGFIMQRAGKWTLRGLVSLSLFDTTKACDLSQYLVFTDVSKFSAWIRSFLQK